MLEEITSNTVNEICKNKERQHHKWKQWGKQVVKTELQSISAMTAHIDQNFSKAIELMLNCQGRVIVTGIGKSGHIARKIAATLASTGSPSFFIHPAEACHGDLGMIVQQDILLAISYTGETSEVLQMITALQHKRILIISLTGKPQSTLAQLADASLSISVEREACALGLAPTASTTACLVMGDALAMTLLQAKNFTADDFSRSHPGGSLGWQLRYRTNQLMRKTVPTVNQDTLIKDAIVEMSLKGIGLTCVVCPKKRLVGVFTDGDLRRTLDKGLDINTIHISEVATMNCKTIHVTMPASKALHMMQAYKINVVIVLNTEQQPIGTLQLYDLLEAGGY